MKAANLSDDLLANLRAAANGDAPYNRQLLLAAVAEIERCHARLEIDHFFRGRDKDGKLVRRSLPYPDRKDFPDAVRCRDETIAGLKAKLEEGG